MELKVWVEGVVRVVCGLSPDTSCQDVVIALAQAIGQTGRYILVLKLRGNERQLIADECPLQYLSQLGQLATEVQFILRRTGPSLSAGQEDTATRERRLPGPPEPEPLKQRKPHKALTFNLGPSSFSQGPKPNRARAALPRTSPEPRASPVLFLEATDPVARSKEEVFRRILQQQRRLQELEVELHALERETQESSSTTVTSPSPVLPEDLQELEQRLKENEAELVHTAHWQAELQAETDREQEMRRRLHETLSWVDDRIHETEELRARSAHLEHDIQLTARRRSSRAATRQQQETLRPLRQELRQRLQQGDQLDATMSGTQEELRAAGSTLQGRRQQIEELNKELRQCNLQQFIQQTGGPHGDHANPPPATEVYLSVAGVVD